MITQGLTTSFKQEILVATHNFTATTGNAFYVALYESSATLNSDTTVYTTSGEITGTGYTAGGALLTSVTPTTSGSTAMCSFSNVTWSTATVTVKGALIYNSTQGNKAVAVLSFGGNKTVSGINFVLTFPTMASTTAIIRFP